MESIEVRKATYPSRRTYDAFFDQYRACNQDSYNLGRSKELIQKKRDLTEEVKKLVKAVFPSSTDKDVLYGKSKIYLKLDYEQKWDAKRFQIIK